MTDGIIVNIYLFISSTFIEPFYMPRTVLDPRDTRRKQKKKSCPLKFIYIPKRKKNTIKT